MKGSSKQTKTDKTKKAIISRKKKKKYKVGSKKN